MKKARLFIALLVMLVAASGYAQDSYRETVKESVAPYLQTYLDQMHSFFKQYITMWFNSDNVDLNQLTDRYADECLSDQLTDFFFTNVKELGISEANLKETMTLLSTPAGMTFQEHQRQWNNALKDELSIMMQNLPMIMVGDTSDPIQPKAGIEAGYIEKYKEAMDGYSGSKITLLMKPIDQISMLFATNNDGEMSDEMEPMQEMQEKVEAWMAANGPTIEMNCAYGIITEDDLDFAAKLKAQNTLKLLDLVPFSVDELSWAGNDFLIDYVEWMQEHGAVLENEEMFDLLKRSMMW
jgi:hypothetical protein